jgi:hypothetical protein
LNGFKTHHPQKSHRTPAFNSTFGAMSAVRVPMQLNRAQNVPSDAELRLAPGQALPASLSFRIEPLSARF